MSCEISINIPTGSFNNKRYREALATYVHPITDSNDDLINITVGKNNLKSLLLQLANEYSLQPSDFTVFPSSNNYCIEFRLPRNTFSNNRYGVVGDIVSTNSRPVQKVMFTTQTTDLNALVDLLQSDYEGVNVNIQKN